MEENKAKYLQENGYIEFNKQEVIEELTQKFGKDKAIKIAQKYKYYKVMSDGNKMFYSENYIEKHSIDELEKVFNEISWPVTTNQLLKITTLWMI